MAANKGQSAIKRFIGNKNVVTILGIAASIGILVVGYFIRVNNSVSTTSIPFAKRSLEARKIIVDGDVGNVRVSQNYIQSAGNIVTSAQEVMGKAVAYYSDIPAGSLFYSTSIMDPESLPNAAFKNIGEGNTIYSLSVDGSKTYSNSIRPGDYIDLYMSTNDPFTEDNIVFGMFIESIKVLGVKSNFGQNILKNGASYGIPNQLLFSVNSKDFLTLKNAELLGIELVPVLHNENYTKEGDTRNTKVDEGYLMSIIESRITHDI